MTFPTDFQLEIGFVDCILQIVDVMCCVVDIDDRTMTVTSDRLPFAIINAFSIEHARECFPQCIEIFIEVANSNVIEDPTKMLAICAAHITGLGATGGFWEQKNAVVLSQRLKPFDKSKVQKQLWDRNETLRIFRFASIVCTRCNRQQVVPVTEPDIATFEQKDFCNP